MLPNLPRDVIDNETLRVYIILPLYHEFMNPKNSVELQLPFGMKLLQIVNSIGLCFSFYSTRTDGMRMFV